jgi:hypothetical protein
MSMPEIRDALIELPPNPDNSSLPPPVPFDVIVRNAYRNDRDICQTQVNLQPFFLLALQCTLDTSWMNTQAKMLFYPNCQI